MPERPRLGRSRPGAPCGRDRACHLDDFSLAAPIAWLGCVHEPGRDRVDPASVPTNFTGIIPIRINSDFGQTRAGFADEELLSRSHLRRSSARVQDYVGLARRLWPIRADL